MAVLALAATVVLGVGTASAVPTFPANYVFLGDGSTPDGSGGWILPTQGRCSPDPTQPTRAECAFGLRLPGTTSAACTGMGGSFSTGVCNDTVNAASQAACQAANANPNTPGRLWNPAVCSIPAGTSATCGGLGGSWLDTSYCNNATYTTSATCTANNATWTSAGRCLVPGATTSAACALTAGSLWTPAVCYVTMRDYDRHQATCEQHLGGTWQAFVSPAGVCMGNWIMPPRLAYSPPLQTGSGNGNSSPGDQCLRCHNNITDYNTYTERYVQQYVDTLHKTNNVPCGRCHGSAVDSTTCTLVGGNPTSCTAVVGLSTHNDNMTVVDAGSGYCTNPLWTTQATCTSNSGIWLTACSIAGSCSNATFTDSLSCANAAGTWTPYSTQSTCQTNAGTWKVGTCSAGGGTCNYATSGDCTAAGGIWATSTLPAPNNTVAVPTCFLANSTVAGPACAAAGKTWTTTWSGDRCHEAGTCSNTNSSASCASSGGTWDSTLLICYISQQNCEAHAGTWSLGTYAATKKQRGPSIIGLCMDCHRQENGGGAPYDSTNPGTNLAVGPVDNTVDFLHAASNDFGAFGNEFLNSPHGKYTSTFANIGSSSYGNGYSSFFQLDPFPPGTNSSNRTTGDGSSCVGCHNPHRSVVNEAEGAVESECQDCHAKNLGAIKHPKGGGTPLENVGSDPASACVTCHMPGARHLFRISTDKNYSTFPLAAMTGTVSAPQAADGSFAPAVWADLDLACGQCHGGGTAQATTTGSISASSVLLTVASAANLAAGNRIRVAGAGVSGADLNTYIASLVSTTVTLAGSASTTVSNAAVIQNPIKNNAGYLTKTQLAGYAKGIHNDEPQVSFGFYLSSPDTQAVNVYAQASCNGPCDAFDWDWGDGSPHGSGVNTSHHYAAPGTYAITLTVEQFGVGAGSKTQNVTVYAADFGPTASGTACNAILHTDWTASIVDSSSDDNAVALVTVNWGDGSMLARQGQGTTFNHTYRAPGTFTITQKALDTIGQQNIRTCVVTVSYFTISGLVVTNDATGNIPIPSATVAVRDATTNAFIRNAYTAANGTFIAGSLPPGTYNLIVTKPGYTFANPAAGPITVGGNQAGFIIKGDPTPTWTPTSAPTPTATP